MKNNSQRKLNQSNVTKVTKKIIINNENTFIDMFICTSKDTTRIYRKKIQIALTLEIFQTSPKQQNSI